MKIQSTVDYIHSTGLFSSVDLRTYPWTQTYASQEYIRLLNTYSDHLRLEESQRRALYQAIADLIDSRFEGKVEIPHLSALYLAKKKA